MHYIRKVCTTWNDEKLEKEKLKLPGSSFSERHDYAASKIQNKYYWPEASFSVYDLYGI